MIKLNTTPITAAYFVNSGVIFKINGDIHTKDSCVTESGLAVYKSPKSKANDPYENQEKLPFYEVKKGTESATTKYFLDSLIEDGDSYSGSKFTKVVHDDELNDYGVSGETSGVTFENYFRALCEVELSHYVMANYSKSYNELFFKETGEHDEDGKPIYENKMDINKLKKIGIPVWMINGNGEYTVVGSNSRYTITLSESDLTEMRENEIRKAAYNAAKSTVEKYDGYTLTKPETWKNVLIKNKQNVEPIFA